MAHRLRRNVVATGSRWLRQSKACLTNSLLCAHGSILYHAAARRPSPGWERKIRLPCGMRRQWIVSLVLGCVLVASARAAGTAAQGLLNSTRQSRSDLEITGMVHGLAANSRGYVRYTDLAKLPQIEAVVDDDPDSPGVTMHVTGVYLDVLAKAVGALPSSDLIDALCTDRYRSHYPADYIAAHHPILVLKIDGMLPAAW